MFTSSDFSFTRKTQKKNSLGISQNQFAMQTVCCEMATSVACLIDFLLQTSTGLTTVPSC